MLMKTIQHKQQSQEQKRPGKKKERKKENLKRWAQNCKLIELTCETNC